MPKPFAGHIGIIQRNVITRWTKLNPRPDIFLFGEEDGTAQIAAELKIGHLRDIRRNGFGTPLLNDLIQRSKEVSKTPMLGYVNCDIILLQEFQDSIIAIQKQFANFLALTHAEKLIYEQVWISKRRGLCSLTSCLRRPR